MAAQSDYLRTKLLNFLDGTAYSPPATVYLGLFVTPVNSDGSGTEVAGGGYARQALTFAAASAGSIATSASATFAPLDSAEANTVFGWGIFDASSAGNLLFYGNVATPIQVAANTNLVIDAGAITISRPTGSAMTEYLTNAWLDKVLRNQAFSAPAAVYLGMLTVAPDDDGTGGTEVAGGGYARQAQGFTVSSDTAVGAIVSFVPLDSAEANAVVAHGWWDAASAGNLLAWRTVYDDTTVDLDVPANDDLSVPDSSLAWRAR